MRNLYPLYLFSPIIRKPPSILLVLLHRHGGPPLSLFRLLDRPANRLLLPKLFGKGIVHPTTEPRLWLHYRILLRLWPPRHHWLPLPLRLGSCLAGGLLLSQLLLLLLVLHSLWLLLLGLGLPRCLGSLPLPFALPGRPLHRPTSLLPAQKFELHLPLRVQAEVLCPTILVRDLILAGLPVVVSHGGQVLLPIDPLDLDLLADCFLHLVPLLDGRVQGADAIGGAAPAVKRSLGGLAVSKVLKLIVVAELLPRLDISHGKDPDSNLACSGVHALLAAAVGLAARVDEPTDVGLVPGVDDVVS
mmetsp:Transcript_7166/g.24635  ORF Transcript_7166/g.24635 Transcript_7166/m.24635 type:complete len:302 (+) Transcript_7166:1278-2183(+)